MGLDKSVSTLFIEPMSSKPPNRADSQYLFDSSKPVPCYKDYRRATTIAGLKTISTSPVLLSLLQQGRPSSKSGLREKHPWVSWHWSVFCHSSWISRTCYDDWLDWFLEGDVKVCLKGGVRCLELQLKAALPATFEKFHQNAGGWKRASAGESRN